MPAARATSSVEVPWKPVRANSWTATRSTSARRSCAVIRVAMVVTSQIVSDDSLYCQALHLLIMSKSARHAGVFAGDDHDQLGERGASRSFLPRKRCKNRL